MTSPTSTVRHFERLYAANADPWDYRTSVYERAKYEATLAALPPGGCARCLEVGCSIGIFTRLLAARCRKTVAVDFSPRALELARENLVGVDNVELRRARFPEEVPAGSWDWIVCSEVLYYLDRSSFEDALTWFAAQLQLGSCLVAVSWTGGSGGEPLLGDYVHDRLQRTFARQHTLTASTERYRIDRFGGCDAPRPSQLPASWPRGST